MNGTFILGDIPGQAVIVTDAAGNIGVASGLAIADLTDLGQGLVAGLVTDSDDFPVPVVSATASLLPALVSDGDNIFAASAVASGSVLPLSFTDDDTFFVPVISLYLLPSAVTDADAIYSSVIGELVLEVAPSFYTDDDTVHAATIAAGAVTLLPGRVLDPAVVIDAFWFGTVTAGPVTLLPAVVADADTLPAPVIGIALVLFPALVADDDAILAATVIPGAVSLLPARVTDADVVYLPAAVFPQTLRPPLVSAGEAVYPAYSIDVAKPPKEQRLRPGRLQNDDVIPAAMFPRSPLLFIDPEFIFAPILDIYYPLTAAFIAGDDVIPAPFIAMQVQAATVDDTEAIYRPTFSLFLLPELLAGDDDIPAADVGWQVIAEFTADADVIPAINVLAYNDLLPETWFDEETIDTYPFFLQQVSGGIPVPKPPDILTGSLSSRRQLTGSIGVRRQLTGSLSNKTRRVLTGSMRR